MALNSSEEVLDSSIEANQPESWVVGRVVNPESLSLHTGVRDPAFSLSPVRGSSSVDTVKYPRNVARKGVSCENQAGKRVLKGREKGVIWRIRDDR